ncbi:hypothetical protein OSH94_24020, partial [Mycobacterium ulcerans]
MVPLGLEQAGVVGAALEAQRAGAAACPAVPPEAAVRVGEAAASRVGPPAAVDQAVGPPGMLP